ncbi:MAG: LL-diaminopimelate aminotransferase [Lachnospiraceae bacterium]|nr:LL-diaminopimelate aminotransferase [Lachnospiraceae bacterium]
MVKLNEHYLELKQSYLFAEIGRRVAAYAAEHPDAKIIRLGIGDVTRPLTPAVVEAMSKAVAEMGQAETFRGYGPEQGYDFLRNAIVDYYARNGVTIAADEVFVSDGAKSDTGNITDLFDPENKVLIPDPVYPVYVDTNTMNGRNIIYMDANAENNFLPMPDPDVDADIIYLCSPNNPTGATYNREQLKAWVDYANSKGAIILFDSAYEAFISDPELPRSIFAIEGARECAIEFCSLSKTAGFTGTRCGYTIVPTELERTSTTGVRQSVKAMWNRRQTTKFNGVSYIVQRGAAAAFSEQGMKEAQENIAYYKENARIIAEVFEKKSVRYFGGINSPYIWFECPKGMDAWTFFDYLLKEVNVVGTPGEGFGTNGTHFFRLTAFGTKEATIEAMKRIESIL